VVCLVAVSLSSSCSRSGEGLRLEALQGGTKVGPGGQALLVAHGVGPGRILWKVIPEGAASLNVSVPLTLGVRGATGIPSSSISSAIATATPGVLAFVVEAWMEGAPSRLRRQLRLQVVEGIRVVLPNGTLRIDAGSEIPLVALVVHPAYPARELPQQVVWTTQDDLLGGSLQRYGGVLDADTTPAWRLRAPHRAGHYTLKARAQADQAAEAVLTLEVVWAAAPAD
jgi:hypothetical protein